MSYRKIYLHAATPEDAAEARNTLRLRGYDVLNMHSVVEQLEFHQLPRKDPRAVRWMTAKLMMETLVVVLHPGMPSALAYNVVQQCRFNSLYCIALGDLPLHPATDSEVLDLHDMAAHTDEAPANKLPRRATLRLRALVSSAHQVWNRFEVRFNARYGWFFTNGRKHHRKVYEEPGALSTTG